MASIRCNKNRLFIDYRWSGRRSRRYTQLPDSIENRQRLADLAKSLEKALEAGKFDPAGFFAAHAAALGELLVEPPTQQVSRSAHGTHGSLATSTLQMPSTPAFASFAELWFTEFKVGWRRTYVTTVRGILDQHLLPAFGFTQLGAVSRAQILEFRSKLSKTRGKKEGSSLSPARINTIILILRQILQEAADRYQFTMPMGKLRPLKIPKSDVNPFTLDQVQLLIKTIRADYTNYLKVRFFTGMRSGELHGLKWKYVDFERRLILVRETFVQGEEEYTKTDASQRDIQMSQIVYDALIEQHKATGKTSTFVFCTRNGEALDNNNVTKRVWYPLLRYLGLDLRRPYQTRHTAATLWLAAGEAPEWIARQLGHASTEMLFRVYSRYVPNLTRRDGSAFDRLLASTFGAGENKATTDNPAPPAQPPPKQQAALA